MAKLPRFLTTVLLLGITASAQRTVEISEPATVAIKDLFKQADVVAVVQILSGDSENYESAVYKSKVLTAFKGTDVGQQLFFGPFIGYEIGGEYVAFLKRAKVAPKVQPRDGPIMAYGPLEAFHLIMYQGYSIMPLRYECAFDGKDPAQTCDYGVRVNTDQVKLPPAVRTFPRTGNDDLAASNRWVRKDVFLRLLGTFK